MGKINFIYLYSNFKIAFMKEEYYMEEGHWKSIEEIYSDIKFMLIDGKTIEEIEEFDDSKTWRKCVRTIKNKLVCGSGYKNI
jgi:hypothetical protein